MKKELSAGGVVFRKKNNQIYVLLVKHTSSNHWGFPKGLVGDQQSNETLEQAALREVKEEGGIKAKIIKKTSIPSQYTYTWEKQRIAKTVWYYLMEYISGDPINHDKEVSEAKFISAQKAKKTLTYKNDVLILQKAWKLLG